LLEGIGTEQDLLHVGKLASGARLARTDTAVQEAANRCVACIEARLAENRVASTLLRSSQPTVGAGTLLRPAATKAPEAQEQLLRAVRSEQEDEQ
jgi:hypothetical protein